MIDIKDFNVGDAVYIKSADRNYETLRQATVIKVGRKYITVFEHGWKTQYSAEDYCPMALVEKVDAGSPSLLFKSEQAYNDYKELKRLVMWLRNAAARMYDDTYSLDQLRKVKAILEAKDE